MQSERLGDLAFHQGLHGLAGHLDERFARQSGAVVGGGGKLTGLAHPARPFLPQIDVQRTDADRVLFNQLAEGAAFETGGVAEQVLHQDRLFEALVLDLVLLRQIDVHGRVDPDVPRLDLPHQRDPGEGLGD